MEENTFEPYPDLMQLHFFEMPKFMEYDQKGMIDKYDRMVKWLRFLANTDDSRWEEMAKREPIIEKAVNKLRLASLDPETRMQYEAREKALKDIASIRGDALREGVEKIARNLLKEGVDIEFVIRVSGLTREEVERLVMELNN